MKLLLELTDDEVAVLRDVLRVSVEDMRMVVLESVQEKHSKLAYAVKIVQARRALGMPVNFKDACDDCVQQDNHDFCTFGN